MVRSEDRTVFAISSLCWAMANCGSMKSPLPPTTPMRSISPLNSAVSTEFPKRVPPSEFDGKNRLKSDSR